MDDGRTRAAATEDDPTGDRARSEDRAEVERRLNHPGSGCASAWSSRQRRPVSIKSEISFLTTRPGGATLHLSVAPLRRCVKKFLHPYALKVIPLCIVVAFDIDKVDLSLHS